MHEDHRVIPAQLQNTITSPPRETSVAAVHIGDKQVLTNMLFKDRWTFVYFSHANCFPECVEPFEKLAKFQSAFASNDIAVAVIDSDSEQNQRGNLAKLVAQKNFKFPIIEAEEASIDALSKTFIALYLRTDLAGGYYQID